MGFWGSLGYLLPGYMGKIIDLWNNHTIQSFIFKSVPMGSLSGTVGISTCMYPKKIYQMNRQIYMDPISVQKDLQLPPTKQLTCQWKHNHLKMYLISNMVIFQSAMFVSSGRYINLPPFFVQLKWQCPCASRDSHWPCHPSPNFLSPKKKTPENQLPIHFWPFIGVIHLPTIDFQGIFVNFQG